MATSIPAGHDNFKGARPKINVKRSQQNSPRSPNSPENEQKKTRTEKTQENNKSNPPSFPTPLRKDLITYGELCQPPYQVILESISEEDPIGERVNSNLTDFLGTLLDYTSGEYCKRKNDRQYILEFNSKERANELVTKGDLTKIRAKAYIPPSYVEIIGVITKVPTQYTEEVLLQNLSTFDDNIKINHVRRFNKTSSNGPKEPLETVAVYFQSPVLPPQVRLFGGLIFSVNQYQRTPLICKRCLHYGHPARLCKHSTPNCDTCAQNHLEAVCPLLLNNVEGSLKCFHCKGNHKGSSPSCPIYKKQLKRMQEMPFPNLHIRQSLKQLTQIPFTLRNFLRSDHSPIDLHHYKFRMNKNPKGTHPKLTLMTWR